MTLTQTHLPQPTGDAVTPFRLSVAPGKASLAVVDGYAAEAEALFARLRAGEAPEVAVRAVLGDAMTVRGYAPEPRAWEPILVLAPTEPCSVTGCALPLADCPDVPRMLTHRPADLPPDARIVLVDGCIVAAAWTTPEGIAVETAPAYRRRGHARAAASALIADLDRAGREVRWRVRASNAASCALAASLGLRETAREYRPTFRRMN